jgi:hypothetical protein
LAPPHLMARAERSWGQRRDDALVRTPHTSALLGRVTGSASQPGAS